MLTIPSVQAQNSFGSLLDKAQRQMVTVTRNGRPLALVMSPEVLEDYIDARLALEAEAGGVLTIEETKTALDRFR